MGTRYVESTNSRLPEQTTNPGDQLGFRHFGDAVAGPVIAARLQAFNASSLAYQDVLIDNATGGVITTGGAAGSSPSKADDAAFTVATDNVSPIGAMADEVAPDSVDEGDAGILRMSLNRNLYVQLRDISAERSAAVTAANALKVDGSAVTQPVSGTVAVSGTVTVDSELPAAAALADAAANPTVPTVGAANLLYNGATWDRVRGDTANGLDVDVTRVSGTVTVDSELPAAAALADAAANPTVPTVGAANLLYNGATWDRIRGDTANGLDVDVTRVSGNVTVIQGTGTNLHTVLDSGTLTSITNTVTVDSELTTADLDTGAGTDTRAVVGIAGAASGGAVLVQATSGGAMKNDITTIAGTAPTTVGKLDVKGADGDVFVRQATASNLNATVTLATASDFTKAEDASHTTADRGAYVLGVRRDALAAETSAAGEYISLVTDQYGRQHTRHGYQADPAMVTVKNHSPAANTQATASAAAAGAGVRWVCTAIHVGIACGGTAPTATSGTWNLRDGATGAGTVLWSGELGVPATAGATQGMSITDLWIPGTANTAMTLEFAAASGANTKQYVNFTAVKLAE